MKLNNKFAIGCLVQWYEIEIFEEYLESLMNSLKEIDNKENVIVDIFFNMAQNLETIDENQITIKEILADDLLFTKVGWIYQYNAIPNNKDNQLTNYFMKKTYEHFYGELND